MLFESAVSDRILIWQSKRALTPLELKEHLVDVTHLWSCFIAAEKTRDLRQKQEELGLPQHTIIGDVATRGSTCEMVSRRVEQQQAVSAILAEDRKNWYIMPTDAEFSVLEGLVEVLKPLSYLTDALSGEKQVTASAVLPVVKHAESKLRICGIYWVVRRNLTILELCLTIYLWPNLGSTASIVSFSEFTTCL